MVMTRQRPFSHRLQGSATAKHAQSSQSVNFYDIFSSLLLCSAFGAQKPQRKPFGMSSLQISVGD